MMPITAFSCPVDGCGWKITSTELELLQMTEGPKFRAKITFREDGPPTIDSSEYAEASAKHTEGILRGHLETHDVFDWVKTVQRLNQDLSQLYGGIRPHVYDWQVRP